jgi:hypothetical protein
MKYTWTKKYHGVTHTEHNLKTYRCSINVSDHGDSILKLWRPGCGFTPEQMVFGTIGAAKAYAEKWLDKMTGEPAEKDTAPLPAVVEALEAAVSTLRASGDRSLEGVAVALEAAIEKLK